jgi:hypothetical protein
MQWFISENFAKAEKASFQQCSFSPSSIEIELLAEHKTT